MRTTVLLCVGWALLVSLPASAELRGVSLYERGDYARARKKLEEELRSDKLSKEERVKARLYLAAALHASGEEESARLQLEQLAISAPSLKVDPILFPPEFVALAEQARKKVDDQLKEAERLREETERQRLEAERQRLEAERKAQEEELARNSPPPPEEESPRSVRLRPELFGFFAPLGKAVGFGGALTLAFSSVDLSARVLAGENVGLGAEVGFLVGDGPVQPRVGLRGTAIPQLSGFGGGAVAGLRVAASERLTFLLDVGAEYLKLSPKGDNPPEYRSFVLTGSAGVGFDLF
jgi:hypothetical protein